METLDVTVNTEDSALGQWTVARWSPPSASQLSDFVEHIWYFDGALAHPRERVFPDGGAELIVMLDERHRDGDKETLAPFPAVCINGLRTRPSVVVAPRGRCRVLGIAFNPLGAASLLRSKMSDLLDVTIDLRSVLGRGADELGARCSDAAESSAWNASRNADAIVRAAADWTVSHIDAGADGDPLVHFAARAIRNANGVVSVNGLGSALGISRARFARRFRDRTGVTPKYFARIVRFSSALSALSHSESIVGAAAELGYYDQAHMYRDFEEFAGMTPGEFLAGHRYPGSASLAEP
ncbi:MAG TPA: helix-turn-helix domain-containing protein [Candidatus Baltobacteraceae bacterium]|jgi:AraC-like DNA-binding protein